MATTNPSRTEKRVGFDLPVRMALAEQDLDTMDGSMQELVAENKKGNRLLQGILVALTTGALLLALDLVTRGVGAG